MADSNDKNLNQSESNDFKVEDKRLFNPDGTPVSKAEESRKSPDQPESPETTKQDGPHTQTEKESEKTAPIDFNSFILSLATTTMANLGEVPDPTTGQVNENLEAAQQMIDILTILQQKTKGNLEPDEDQLIENLLYELRMKYLSKAKIINI